MAEDCRGSVDGWDFKQYVLGMLFYRFISENLTKYINKREHDSDDKNFDYAKLTDKEAVVAREEMIKEKGFYILPSELFVNVVKHASNDENLNETLARIFRNIENSAKGYESEDDLKGLFDEVDLSSKKIGDSVKSRNERLVKLLNSIANLSFAGDYNDNQNDTFGDAYEYLMSMYASSAGKSGGEFFTPQEVGELLARIVADGKTAIDKVYDPCCGSGGLLLKFAKVLGKDNVDKYYGQDVNLTSHKLCRMNMFLHDINYHKFDIKSGDTLLSPQHAADEPFDAIVSNPPYSIK
jgi:type I restriction enzyme M protein